MRRIREAAAALLTERGYAGTSISAISQRSGLPASSIYWHFESKEGLIDAVIVHGVKEFFGSLPDWNELTPKDPRERMRIAFSYASNLFEQRPEFLRLLYLVVLERRQMAPTTRKAVHTARELALNGLRITIEGVYAHEGKEIAHRVAERLKRFGQAFFDGCFLGYEMDPDTLDLAEMMRYVEIAILAVGDRLIAEERAQ